MTDLPNERNKKVSDSLAEQVHVLTMETLNGNQRLSGAKLMCWIDEVATIVARRHAESDVTTARMNNLRFLHPAINKDTVVVKGHIVYAGRTSMKIKVEAFIERFFGENKLIADAELWFVALDESEKPVCVPSLLLETDEEKEEFEIAKEEKSRMTR